MTETFHARMIYTQVDFDGDVAAVAAVEPSGDNELRCFDAGSCFQDHNPILLWCHPGDFAFD